LICYRMLQLKEKWIIYKEKVMLTGLERKNWRGGFRGLQAHHSYSWLDSDSVYNIIALCPFKWFGAVLELVSKIYLS